MTIQVLSDDLTLTLSPQPEQTLLDVLREENIHVSAPCGGQGTCGKCTVYVVQSQQEIPVKACRTLAEEGMTIRLPMTQSLAVETRTGEASMPSPPDSGIDGYGIACDIGTTTVVCHLVELATGNVIATIGEENAQRAYGHDVLARIKASMEGKQAALTAAIQTQLRAMIERLQAAAGIQCSQILRMAVAANTTMCHLLTGLSPDSLGTAPFLPVSRFGDVWDAKALHLPMDAPVYICPAASGYVGGDITADLLQVQADCADAPILLIDVGTNGEIALGHGNHILCCSTAAGPAFEGAQITCGMTAAPGAISAVAWTQDRLCCKVIGGGEASGICGSGLVDAVAVMLELGAVDETGRMLDADEDDIPNQVSKYLFHLDGQPAFRLAEHVWVTQADVRKLQLGKGAIVAGIQVLMDAYGITCEEISALLLAGGFGTYIKPESAARIGLIPFHLLPVTHAVGNTAALGARAALVAHAAVERLGVLQKSMQYLELSGLPAFNDAYIDAMLFPEGA